MFSKDTTMDEFFNQLVRVKIVLSLFFFGRLDLNLLSSKNNSCSRNGGRFALETLWWGKRGGFQSPLGNKKDLNLCLSHPRNIFITTFVTQRRGTVSFSSGFDIRQTLCSTTAKCVPTRTVFAFWLGWMVTLSHWDPSWDAQKQKWS